MNRLTISDLPLAGVKRIARTRIGDSRGWFSRVFCKAELAAAGWDGPIAQINLSFTQRAGTVRGMHFQRAPHAEQKLVSCIRGAVWDVAVDLRPASATYLAWHAEELSAESGAAMLIPAGFAHGYQTLTDDTELLYCHSAAFAPEFEAGLNPLDRDLAIDWPDAVTEMSERDRAHAFLQTSR